MLQYKFVNAYPISINSIPVSYDTSQLLKCTVSFYYSRYVVIGLTGVGGNSSNSNNPGNPESDVSAATGRALTPTNIDDITINTFQNWR